MSNDPDRKVNLWGLGLSVALGVSMWAGLFALIAAVTP